VSEVNSVLNNSPETINSDPYGTGWMVKVSDVDPNSLTGLLDAASYLKITENQ
jgi:glycine cleavage system H protein